MDGYFLGLFSVDHYNYVEAIFDICERYLTPNKNSC